MADPCHRILVYGRVQGVGFRDWTQRTARSRGLSGWCRNRSDGTVEILVAGTADDLGAFRNDLEHGPGPANVDRVDVTDGVVEDLPASGFDVRSTL